jgi:hypothetical protein
MDAPDCAGIDSNGGIAARSRAQSGSGPSRKNDDRMGQAKAKNVRGRKLSNFSQADLRTHEFEQGNEENNQKGEIEKNRLELSDEPMDLAE